MAYPLFDNFNDAVIAAHRDAKTNGRGYAFAIQWPLGHFSVEPNKPSLRDLRMRVVECQEDGSELMA